MEAQFKRWKCDPESSLHKHATFLGVGKGFTEEGVTFNSKGTKGLVRSREKGFYVKGNSLDNDKTFSAEKKPTFYDVPAARSTS